MTRAVHQVASRWRPWMFCIGLVLAGAAHGCGGDEPQAPAADEQPLLPPAEGRAIVEVDGIAITDAQLAAAMQTAPAGATEIEVLASLVELQLVAQRAREAGLDASPSVALARQRAMVQRLLAEEVEAATDVVVDEAEVRQVYDEFAMEFFEPELVTASHLLVHVPEALQQDEPERLDRAVALARSIRAALTATGDDAAPSDAELRRLAWLGNLRGELVTVETGLRFPRRPLAPLMGQAPRYPAMVEPFAAAAFALDTEHPLSEPVVSPFGVHLIVLRARSEPKRPPYAEVRDTIHDDLLRRRRGQRARALVERVRASARVEVDDGPIREP